MLIIFEPYYYFLALCPPFVLPTEEADFPFSSLFVIFEELEDYEELFLDWRQPRICVKANKNHIVNKSATSVFKKKSYNVLSSKAERLYFKNAKKRNVNFRDEQQESAMQERATHKNDTTFF